MSRPVAKSVVALCIPSGDQVSASFALDLAKLVGFVARTHREIDLVLLQVKGSILPQQRATLVQAALTAHATHVFWLDSDMRFPKDALVRLLAHDVPIVAANYPTRRPPIVPVAQRNAEGHLFTTAHAKGLVPVDAVGMGCMLVQASVYHALPKPWFALGYSRSDDGYVGEDHYFCQQARAKGFSVAVDQALSQEVQHLGEMAWTHAHAEQTRTAYLAEPVGALSE